MVVKLSTAFPLALGILLQATAVSAHAQLQQAVPAVGGTVKGSPGTLSLTFSEGVEPRFSAVTLAGPAGKSVPLGPLSVAPPGAAVVVVKVRGALAPGTYTVKWHVLSVDSHKTQGSYRFTVLP